MRGVKQFGAVVVVAVLGSVVVQAMQGSWWLSLASGIVAAVLMVLVYRWVVGRTEQRLVPEVGRAGAGSGFARGLGIGVGIFATVIGIIALAGGYRIDGWGSPAAAVGLLGLTATVVAAEELVFRGLVQRLLEERLGTWIALAATAVLFGAVHLVNPDATLWGAAAVAIEGGGMLGAAYAATRTLWLPMGLHFGWNIAGGGIFGTVVSGSGTPQGLLDGATSGPALLTGGAFGPEGSVVAVVACSIVTVVLLGLAHRRGRIVPRRHAARPTARATVAA